MGRPRSDVCGKCGVHPKRENDHMCRLCRNEYMRQRRAIAKHGAALEGYKPTGPVPPKVYTPKQKIRAVPKGFNANSHVPTGWDKKKMH